VSEVKLDVWSVKPVTTVSSTTRIAQMTLARSGLRQPSRQPPKTKNLTALAVAHAHSLTHPFADQRTATHCCSHDHDHDHADADIEHPPYRRRLHWTLTICWMRPRNWERK
jgi:hypothetical protein